MTSRYINKYEREIIDNIKNYAQQNNIPFSKMTEILILNTIRTVKEDCKNLYLTKQNKIRILKNLQNP